MSTKAPDDAFAIRLNDAVEGAKEQDTFAWNQLETLYRPEVLGWFMRRPSPDSLASLYDEVYYMVDEWCDSESEFLAHFTKVRVAQLAKSNDPLKHHGEQQLV